MYKRQQSVRPNGKPRVYRNEDTGLAWPPYLKFDSSNLAAVAEEFAKEDDQWVAVSHYGWRIELFTIFPNAYKIQPVAGPDVRLIPWFNIIFLSLLGLFILWLWSKWRRFRKKRIDPVAEKVSEAADNLGEKASSELSQKSSGFRKFMRRWFGSK